MAHYLVPPSAPSASALSGGAAEAEIASVPHDLKGYSADKLTGLSGEALASLCTLRGLAKGGSKADKVARLLAWKKQNKPKGEKKRPREDAPAHQQLDVHVHVGVKSAAPKVAACMLVVLAPLTLSQTAAAASSSSHSGLSGLTIPQLQEICIAHGLTKSGAKEVVVGRIKAALDQKSFTVEILKVEWSCVLCFVCVCLTLLS
jgi:hypothetical protein